MTITHDFLYFKPKNIDEALQLLSKYKSKVLAGGTDLICYLKENLVAPESVIDIKALSELTKITVANNMLEIGALVTFSDILDSKVIAQYFPILQEMAITAASVGVRNRATIAGNICSAVPSCDSAPVLLACDASVVVRGADINGENIIPLTQWFLGPKKTALKGNEMVTKILLPLPEGKSAGCYVKLGRYRGEDLAQASVAIFADQASCKIAFGAVALTPIRAYKIEEAFAKKGCDFSSVLSDAVIAELTAIIPQIINPITDIRASKEYRLHMMKVMFERGLKAVQTRMQNDLPVYGTMLV